MGLVRHKVFISYHQNDDSTKVKEFVETFDEDRSVFITRAIVDVEQDIIDSDNSDYVMRRIRELYLKDSTVTSSGSSQQQSPETAGRQCSPVGQSASQTGYAMKTGSHSIKPRV